MKSLSLEKLEKTKGGHVAFPFIGQVLNKQILFQ